VAHNANYLVWFELARVDFLAHFAGGYNALRAHGIEAFVTESYIRYGAPAHFDDAIRIHSRCLDVRGARFRFEYLVERDGEQVAEGWTAHGCVDAQTLRPTRVPNWLVEAIATAAEQAGQPAPSSSES
jgi:acyl-CoA thioester hydrolase